MPQLDPGARIAELEAKVEALTKALDKALARISELEAEHVQLRAENAELRARLGQNSQNSSKPPSSDPPGTPRQPKEPTGRARGGQPGHKGHRRELLRADRVVPVLPARCGRCQRRLRGTDPEPWIHQVVELPEIRPDVTDYELHELGCECGARTRATLPPGVPQGAFGPRLMAAVALCTSRFHMPKRMAREFLGDMLGVDVALGSISKMEQAVSEAIAAPVEEEEICGRSVEEKRAVREASSRPVHDELLAWCKAHQRHEPPASPMGAAIRYLLNHQVALRRFLEDGRVPIDNGIVERLHVRTALTRKNFLFAGSDTGAERAAIAYTLLGCCELADVNSVEYLADVLPRLARRVRLCDAPALLPARWKAARTAAAAAPPLAP